jgi:anti-anti-sigma factor
MSMDLSTEQLDGGIKRLVLKGRMDIEGTEKIGLRLSVETASERTYLVFDLSGVEFMASVGIGVLLRSVKALRLRGGDAVILNPRPVVEMVLKHTQIDTVIPVFHEFDAALKALRPA